VIRRTLEKHQDKRRHERFLDELQAFEEPQARDRLQLQRRHEAQSLDMDRHLRALAQVEARELQSLETTLQREQRNETYQGRRQTRMPAPRSANGHANIICPTT
jgi:hypothetical protein